MSDQLIATPEAVEEFTALMRDPAARQAFVELKAAHATDGTRRRYQHVLRAVASTPWAILESRLPIILDILAMHAAAGGPLPADVIEARLGAARQRQAAPASGGGVAVLPLHGVIIPKADMMSEMSGGTSIASFRQSFRQAMASDEVSAIVLDVDSPGGMVDGVPEMAEEMRAARGTKPIVAVANTEAASAAYWLATQADELWATKSARVGSIGVFSAHEDRSAKAEAEGIATTLVSAGKFKTEGNPFEELTDEARAHLQAQVDSYYGMFVGDVAKGRGTAVDVVRTGFGEGRVLGAEAAQREGMIDGIATTEEMVGRMLTAPTLQAHDDGPITWGASEWGVFHLPVRNTDTANANSAAPEPEEPDEAALAEQRLLSLRAEIARLHE